MVAQRARDAAGSTRTGVLPRYISSFGGVNAQEASGRPERTCGHLRSWRALRRRGAQRCGRKGRQLQGQDASGDDEHASECPPRRWRGGACPKPRALRSPRLALLTLLLGALLLVTHPCTWPRHHSSRLATHRSASPRTETPTFLQPPRCGAARSWRSGLRIAARGVEPGGVLAQRARREAVAQLLASIEAMCSAGAARKGSEGVWTGHFVWMWP